MKLGNVSQSIVPVPKFFTDQSIRTIELFKPNEFSQKKINNKRKMNYFRSYDLLMSNKDINLNHNPRTFTNEKDSHDEKKYVPIYDRTFYPSNADKKETYFPHIINTFKVKNLDVPSNKNEYKNVFKYLKNTNLNHFLKKDLRQEIMDDTKNLIDRINITYDLKKWNDFNCRTTMNKEFQPAYSPLTDAIQSTGDYKEDFVKTLHKKSLGLKTITEKSKMILKNNIKNKEKKEKIDTFAHQIDELLNNIKVTKDSYLKEVEEKMKYFNQVIDVIKESYKYYYNLLENEKQDFYTIDYLNKIVEILDIQTLYSNLDELVEATNLVAKFSSKTQFLYRINTNEMPSPYTIDTYSFNKLKKSIKSKFSFLNAKQIKYEKKLNLIINSVYAITKINDKNGIAVASGNDILIIEDIDEYDEKNQQTMSGHSKNVNCLILLTPNKLVSGSEDKTIKIWDIQKRLCVSTITGNYERIESLLKINDNTIAVGSHHTIRVFNTDNKKELYSLVGHEKSVCTMIKISEDKIVSGSYDNLIKIWDINSHSCEYTLYGHDTTVFVVLLLQDGKLASGSGSRDRALKIWDLENKRCHCTLVGHKREIRCMSQMSNGWLLTGSVDKTVKVWNVKRKCCIQTLVSHFDAVYSLCIIDKERFVSGGKDQDLIVWKY